MISCVSHLLSNIKYKHAAKNGGGTEALMSERKQENTKENPKNNTPDSLTGNQKENQLRIDNFDYLSNAASAMDYTGLIPSLPQSREELESYNDICQLHPEVPGKEKEKPT